MNNVKFVDPQITSIEKKNLKKAINSGWISFGPYVESFEKKLSEITKTNHCISVNNGTNAILLILICLNFKKGDEVIVPSFSYISPIHMLKLMGLVPIPVDISLDNLQINEDQILKKINKRTKAILLIHSYGSICDLEKVKAIAKKKKLYVIEDISEVIFSKYKKNYVGSCNWYNKEKLISYSSLHASKTIISGEGGVILTNSKKICKKLKTLRNHGQKNNKPYFYEMNGGNFRLSNLLASIGYSQLLRIRDIMNKKKKIDNLYNKKLLNNDNFTLMKIPQNFNPIKWGFPILFKKEKDKKNIMKILNKNSTLCRPGFYSLNKLKHLNIFNNKLTTKLDFEKALTATKSVLVLPMHNKLKNKEINNICSKINNYFEK
jgi:perosamine synthetase